MATQKHIVKDQMATAIVFAYVHQIEAAIYSETIPESVIYIILSFYFQIIESFQHQQNLNLSFTKNMRMVTKSKTDEFTKNLPIYGSFVADQLFYYNSIIQWTIKYHSMQNKDTPIFWLGIVDSKYANHTIQRASQYSGFKEFEEGISRFTNYGFNISHTDQWLSIDNTIAMGWWDDRCGPRLWEDNDLLGIGKTKINLNKDNEFILRFSIYDARMQLFVNGTEHCQVYINIDPSRNYQLGLLLSKGCFKIEVIDTSILNADTSMTSKTKEDNGKGGRLTQEEIDKIVAEAEKYREEDEEKRKTIQAKNDLESIAYKMRNTVDDEKFRDLISYEDKQNVRNIVNVTINWVDANPNAEKEEYEAKKKELEDVFGEIMRNANMWLELDNLNQDFAANGGGGKN